MVKADSKSNGHKYSSWIHIFLHTYFNDAFYTVAVCDMLVYILLPKLHIKSEKYTGR